MSARAARSTPSQAGPAAQRRRRARARGLPARPDGRPEVAQSLPGRERDRLDLGPATPRVAGGLLRPGALLPDLGSSPTASSGRGRTSGPSSPRLEAFRFDLESRGIRELEIDAAVEEWELQAFLELLNMPGGELQQLGGASGFLSTARRPAGARRAPPATAERPRRTRARPPGRPFRPAGTRSTSSSRRSSGSPRRDSRISPTTGPHWSPGSRTSPSRGPAASTRRSG